MENQESTQPHLLLTHKLFLLTHPDVEDIDKVRLRDEVQTAIIADDMVPLYETLVSSGQLNLDQSLLDKMGAKIKEELKKLDEKSMKLEFLK